MDKFVLVYEFNKNSPLLVYKAFKEIEERNISNAIELLNLSIEKYPYYPTAYFLLAIALAYNNDYPKADEMIAKGKILLDEKETIQYYSEMIEQIKRENSGIDNSFDDTVSLLLDESFKKNNEFYNFDDLDIIVEEKSMSKDKLTKSKIAEGTIVTETLAEIYQTQGNYTEALDIYQRLIKLQPEKIDTFNKKIIELNNTIGSKK